MATRTWTGNAVATKDVYTVTIANTWATGDTVTVTINGKDLVVTIGTLVTTAQVATSLKEAWESSAFTDTTASCIPQGGGTSIPEMSELTATVSGSVVTFTADVAGVPHTISASEVTAGSGTATAAHATTATGPNYFDNVDNWAEGSVATTGDDMVVDRPVSILYALAQSAVTLTSLTITERFTSTAHIGLPFRNDGGYEEYRATELAISATTITARSKSALIKINLGTAQTTASIFGGATSAETNRPAFQICGTHTSNVFNVLGATANVGIGANDEASAIATLRQTLGTVTVGKNVTQLTTYNKSSGTGYLKCLATTVTNSAGAMAIEGSGAITTLNVGGGTVSHAGTGTVTTANISNSGVLDFNGSNLAITMTNTNLNDNGMILDRNDRVTFTNPIAWAGSLRVSP